jgi:drug/metabolite transporter (DMT)-like permease
MMSAKKGVDAQGIVFLVGLSLLLAFNQIVIKVTNQGFEPVFAAGIRSLGGLLIVWAWMFWRGIPIVLARRVLLPGIGLGLLFSFEFFCLFLALDFTSVARASILFYSMPIWLAIGAHFLLPNERLTMQRSAGLLIAMAGVIWVLADHEAATETRIWGDLLALAGALGWASLALCVRLTALSNEKPEAQLFIQLLISAPVLLMLAPFFGPSLRQPELVHVLGLSFQIVAIAGFAFAFWFWLIKVYKASSVASFSFLSPVFSVVFGWILLGEALNATVILSLGLVTIGLILVNRR